MAVSTLGGMLETVSLRLRYLFALCAQRLARTQITK